jgi:hypothetical protein
MTGQLDLLAYGQQLRKQGMRRVLDATDLRWKQAANKALAHLAESGQPFTAEDVRAIAGDPPRPNAMGAILRAGARRHDLIKVGRQPATRPELHASELTVWQRKDTA